MKINDRLLLITEYLFKNYFNTTDYCLFKFISKYLEIINPDYENEVDAKKIILDFLLIVHIIIKLMCDHCLSIQIVKETYEKTTRCVLDIEYIKEREMIIYMKLWKEINYDEIIEHHKLCDLPK